MGSRRPAGLTPDDLRSMLDEERTQDQPAGILELTVADRVDVDEEDERRIGGLL